ncbi:MAG: nucleotide exchange factor GrpE [Minisyncoccia bacterium]
MKDENKQIKDNEANIEPTEEITDIDDVTFETEGDSDMQKDPQDIIKKLRAKIKKLEGEKQEYLDGWQRSRADFANFKKINEEEKKAFVSFANRNLITEIIPVLESFDMAMSNKEAWDKVPTNWRVGVEYIAQQLHGILENQGIKVINPAIGEVFDVTKHEAVEHVPTDKKENDHKVVSVVKKGYLYKDIVIIPARVNIGEFKE